MTNSIIGSVRERILKSDPRYSIAAFLFGYLVLGFTVLGFNRTPFQAALITLACCGFEVFLARLFKGKWIFPLSALITSFSLALLLNFSHGYHLLLIPALFAIGTKYVFTFNGRHVFNPAQIAVTLCLLFVPDLITLAPAYQWNGIPSLWIFMAMLAVIFLVPQVRRQWLVISFLVTFTIQTALRAFIMRHHLPFETLFLGTITSPAFFLFTFFMITDPATSPSSKRAQILTGIAIALVDLSLHLRQSYYTFFYAGAIVAGTRFVWNHFWAFRSEGREYFLSRFVRSKYPLRLAVNAVLLLAVTQIAVGRPAAPGEFVAQASQFQKIPSEQTGFHFPYGDVLDRTDPRIHHIVKWLLSVGDSVLAADYDGDGLTDLFFTQILKADGSRNVLFKNLGSWKFERVPIPAIEEASRDIETHGLISGGAFVDYDNDGDLDLFLSKAFGHPILLQNQLAQTKRAHFKDVSSEAGLDFYTNSLASNFLDVNRDGRLDLLIGNVLPEHLPGYATPTKLNFFRLPQPAYAGDERMFDFMHESWHMANNGGKNVLLLQNETGAFVRQDSDAWGIPETRWTLAIGTGDFNRDGWTDMYVANDFGPDDLYFNEKGRHFANIKGTMFGAVGRDTYKGMNATVADFDNNGWLDVYISNVHHALQAEGSLLWMFGPGQNGRPVIEDRATQLGALNESRFGWGAAAGDLNNDGWLDIVQANGMVDDFHDKKHETCPDYWYVNEKIARSPPEIHRFVNKWGDIRGMCIYGREKNRVYFSTGGPDRLKFVDLSGETGFTEESQSRGVAIADFDNDGKLDTVITQQFHDPLVFRNTGVPGGEKRHWIGFQLEGNGQSCNRQGVGSRITLHRKKGGDLVRESHVVDGFNAQVDPRIHFGLGGDDGPVDVSIEWCGKEVVEYPGLQIDRYHMLKQSPLLLGRREK